jgi:hypothetical protein
MINIGTEAETFRMIDGFNNKHSLNKRRWMDLKIVGQAFTLFLAVATLFLVVELSFDFLEALLVDRSTDFR